MASNVEKYSEKDMPRAENDMAGAENEITNAENDMPGAENDIYGLEKDMTGAENDITEAENKMPEPDKNLDGTESTIGGIDNVVNGDDNNMAGTTEHTENQHGHNVEAGVKSTEKRWPGWPGESVFRILVPTRKVGGIIGRKGEFIKKMCGDSKSRIKVLECPPGAPERAVLISARDEPDSAISPSIDGLLRIHKRIIDGIDGEDQASQNAGNREVTRLLAGATQAASLIGKHGSTIKSIQEASKCNIRVIDDVPPFALPDDKVVEIQGEAAGMHKALELIASHLRKFLVDRSVIPLFEFSMQRPISQMQQSMPPPQSWGPPQGPPPNSGGPGYGGSSQFMPPRQHDNYYPPVEHPPFEKPPHYGISTFGRDVPPMGGGHPSNSQHGQPPVNQVTQHMQVPISFADAVIGAGGANISYIRRASGATITIQETRGVPGEMTVEINGSATQVQTAQQLIQNFMAEAGASAAQNTAPPPAEYGYNSSYPPQTYGMATYAAPEANAAPAAPPAAGYGGNYASYGANYGY